MTKYQLLIATACCGVLGIPTIQIKGSKFFTSNGNQFYIKGITYQSSTSSNYLTNGDQCKIDAKLIAATGANVIRVYSVDPTLNHDVCMQAFADQSIYVICDMSTPSFYIDRTNPKWTMDLRNQFAKVLDGFHQYDNLLALFAGNEVISEPNTTIAASAVKAVIADMKAYRDLMQYRNIPIGYSSTDERTAPLLQDFLDCGNSTISADFFALNQYSWCGSSSFTQSGYDQLYARADGYDIPIFLSETGCNTISPRDFSDQVAVLGRLMNDRFSGSIIYEWHNEASKYGIANYSDAALTGTPTLLPEYTSLKSQWSTLSPAGVKATAYNPSLTKRSCPQSTAGTWLLDAKDGTQLPTLGLSGFSAPSGTQASTMKGNLVGTGSPAEGTGGGYTGSRKSSKLGGGAIAGIVIGVVVLLLLVLGALFLVRRRKKGKESPADGNAQGQSDVNAEDPSSAAYKGIGPMPELYGASPPQELNALQSWHELRGDARPGELPYQHEGQPYSPVVGTAPVLEDAYSENRPTAEPSEHVQAQRRREIEWLRSEELRMQHRREQLMNQGSGAQERS